MRGPLACRQRLGYALVSVGTVWAILSNGLPDLLAAVDVLLEELG